MQNNFTNKKLFKYIILLSFFFLIINNIELFSQKENLENQLIYRIIYKNLNKAKKKDILPLIFSQEGTKLDLGIIDEDYQRLMGLGYFEDIVITTDIAYDERTNQTIKGMINLIYEFIEKPTIRKIIFRGNQKVSYALLMKDITIKRGEFFDLSKVNSDISAIKNQYKERGFNYAKIVYELFQDEELKETNKIDLIFKIEEGIETYVSEIIISGNENISSITLKNKMKTKERKYFGLQKGGYSESIFNQDIEEIKKYYRDQGYFLIEIKEPEISYYELEEKGLKKEIVRVKITLIENDQYKFGGIKLVGNKIFSNEDLLSDAKINEGQIFNFSKYKETIYLMQKKYNDGGYIQTEVTDNTIIDKDKKTITVEVVIKESKRSYIEAVYFKGNDKTKNYILERSVYTEPGEIFNSSKLMDSMIALYNLGFFINVEYDIQQGSAPGLLKITYILEEQQTADIKFGLTIPATQWPPEVTLFIELNERNLTGREIILSGKVEASLYKQGFSFNIDDPWFLNYPWNIGGSVKFYHNWIRKVLRELEDGDYNYYNNHNDDDKDEDDENDVRQWLNEDAGNVDQANRNYLGYENNSFTDMGIHNVNFEFAARSGYRFLKYFGISGFLSCEPIFTWIPGINGEASDLASESLANTIGEWRVRNKFSSTFSIDTTRRKINPYEGIRFSTTAAYTFGHFDSFFIGTKFSVYWKTLDLNFNDFPFVNVMVFNAGISMILPGFRDLGGQLYGKPTFGEGPILYSGDILSIDGLFSGRGWNNSLAGYSYLAYKTGYLKFDYSLEYRIPIYDKIIWVASFIDMINLVSGPYPNEPENSWMWWKNDDKNYQPMGIDNWYGSIGVGIELTFPQLPLSFFVVKRFKVNYYSGFEWQSNNVGGIDFVLSMVGYYF